jgi:hypothetical protein
LNPATPSRPDLADFIQHLRRFVLDEAAAQRMQIEQA